MKVNALSTRTTLLASLLCAALLGCGGDGGSTDGDGMGASGGGGGSGGAGGGGSGGSSCVATAGDAVVLAPENLSEGSVIYRMETDTTHLYFSTINRLYRVPLAGGAAEELYFRDLAIVIFFWVRADDIVLMEGRKVVSLPKGGGATTELAALDDSPTTSLDGRITAVLRGDTLYAKSRKGIGDDVEVTYFATDLTTGESRILYQGPEGANSDIVVTSEHLYFTSTDQSMVPADEDFPVGVPDLLYRVPLSGGALEQVSLGDAPLQVALVGADAESLYVNASPPMSALDSGISRVPFDGGTPERVLDGSFLFGSILEHIPVEGKSYLRALDDIYELQTSGAAQKVSCVADDAHSMAVDDDSIFVAIFQKEGEKSGIVRLPR